jgi:DHA3 family macrolide efflux protein-like MFS transporter
MKSTAENWKNKTVLFLGSQTISLFGSSLVQYAITWYITLTTQSGAMMTVSILCGFLPTFILSPFAGVWADRYNRKRLIIYADALVAVSTLFLAIMFFNGYQSLWLIFAVSGIRAVGTGIQSPAVGAILPQIVPTEKLTRVNGINASLQSSTMLVSPVVSGALMSLSSVENIFFIDVFTAAAAISILLFFLKIPLHAKAGEKQTVGYFHDLRMGFDYIRNHPFVKRLFVYYAVLFVLVSPVAFLTPLQVTRSFGPDVWRLTAVEIAFSVGMMGGGAVIAAWGGFKNRIYTMAMASVMVGAGTLALGVTSLFGLYLAFMGLTGLAVPLFNTPATVLLQEKVEEDYLGRVFGVLTMISTSMMPLGMLFFGPLADHIQIEWVLLATGTMLAAQGFFLLGSRKLLREGYKPGNHIQ